jgi:thiamine-phosphate pyrophosphorylase
MWDKLKEKFNLLKLEKKKLYLVTNSNKCRTKDEFLDTIASSLQGGVDIVQLHENSLPDNVLVDIGHKIRILCDEFGATFIINNRVDIAQIVEADGVHLGQNDINISDARKLLGPHSIIGKTVCSAGDIFKAEEDGADYVLTTKITTNKKQEKNIDIELSEIEDIKDKCEIPIFVQADVTAENINSFRAIGIDKFVVSDLIMGASRPEQVARNLLK